MSGPPGQSDGVRLSELVALMSLGADLGLGQPMEHALRQCLLDLRIADRLGLGEEERTSVRSAPGSSGCASRWPSPPPDGGTPTS
jgi:hypothetical protein